MAGRIGSHSIAVCIIIMAGIFLAPHASAENVAKGELTVDGKAFEMRKAYAYSEEGFFDRKKQDIVVLLCSAGVSAEAVRDSFARRPLVASGTLQCVRQVINSKKQVINYSVEARRFGNMMPNGASTENVFDASTFDGKTIAGRSYMKSTGKSFDDVPFTYDITFSAAIEPMK